VKASSWTPVAPASRMWYPLIEIGFQRGISFAQNSIMSTTSRTAGRGGMIHSFWAMYSLRMSAWMVPPRTARGTPCFSAAAMYMHSATIAGALMVIEVVTSRNGIPANSTSKSLSVETATPSLPTSPSDIGWSQS
jgi:hypothetical protein